MIEVGDRVVCVDAGGGVSKLLIVGSEYTAFGLTECCGKVWIDIGGNEPMTGCSNCGRIHKGDWFSIKFFRKIQDHTASTSITVSKQIKETLPQRKLTEV